MQLDKFRWNLGFLPDALPDCTSLSQIEARTVRTRIVVTWSLFPLRFLHMLADWTNKSLELSLIFQPTQHTLACINNSY